MKRWAMSQAFGSMAKIPPMKTGKQLLQVYVSERVGDLLNEILANSLGQLIGPSCLKKKDFDKIAIAALRDKIKEIQEIK